MAQLGAGEIILTNVNREGLRSGLDLESIEIASKRTRLPLIAHGGVGSINDISDGLAAGADAIAAGSFLVFHGKSDAVLITYPSL